MTINRKQATFAARIVTAVALAGAVCAMVLGGTSASASPSQLPWKASFSGSASFTSPTTTVFVGHGHASFMGAVATDGHVCLPSSTCSPSPTRSCANGIPNINLETLTALNLFGRSTRDTLTIRSQDVACPTGTNQFHGMGDWTVVSGTGRFRYATGSGTFDGHVDFNAGTYSMTLTGVVGPIVLL